MAHAITMRELQKLSASTIERLPGAVPVQSDGRTVALLVPLRPASDEARARFRTRPGLTGLWQVSGRSAMGTLEMLHLDLAYVHSRNLVGDLSILARTVPAMLKDSTAK